MFNILTETVGGITRGLIRGRLDTVNSSTFNQALQSILEKEDFLILDFTECDYLSSSGIRVLMAASKVLTASGGALLLSGISPAIRNILEITGLLTIFPVFDNLGEAAKEIRKRREEVSPEREFTLEGHRLLFRDLRRGPRKVRICRETDIVGYDELGFAMGTGSPAEKLTEDPAQRGLFAVLGRCAGFIPAHTPEMADFRVVRQASEGGIHVQQAQLFGLEPGSLMTLASPGPVTPELLYRAAVQIQSFTRMEPLVALAIASDTPGNASVILAFTEVSGTTPIPPETAGGPPLTGLKFLLDELPAETPGISFQRYMDEILTMDHLEGVESLDPAEPLYQSRVWLFHAGGAEDFNSQRISVETAGDFPFEPWKAFLARRLYTDSSRVVVRPLHGGYSAQTCQVESYDDSGRKLRPTVLKIASRALITRESERCQRYALPYIMNNSAMVLGTAFYGDMGALRYNFVGIGGDESQLRWLTHYYNEWSGEKLEPLFDKLFLHILKPWYGQPVAEKIHPFRDHDPTLTFFPALCDTARELLSFPPEEQFMALKEADERLLNPYWFLKYEYPRRRNVPVSYYTSVCHGDLNMQNVLLDEAENMYLIDFSETRPRSVVSDFARLEAIFMVEKAPLEDEEDLRKMIRFLIPFYRNSTLAMENQERWKGRGQDIMDRNLFLTRKMRQYSLHCTGGQTSPVPYYIAMLEWVLPIVCYGGGSLLHKKLSAAVAALLCEEVMRQI